MKNSDDMKILSQKLSLDKHRKGYEYSDHSNHHEVLIRSNVRKIPKSNFDILHEIGLRFGD